MKGYLVVLKQPVRWDERNPGYRGLYGGPGWRDQPEEAEATDAYIWGPYTDDDQGGLIPTLELARELYGLFGDSPREFEIIYAQTLDEPGPGVERPLVGYDVACMSPFWSMVADWPREKVSEAFLPHLNEYGLFGSSEDAAAFLERFRALHPEKHRTKLFIWRIEAVPFSP